MNTSNQKFEKTAIVVISIIFTIWGAAFIYKSSFIAVDGHRYFSLFDDAMVSMRYAWNLSHGLGLVWNPGETIQGYTNLLMTLVMSLATLAFDKSTAVLSIQILGIGFMLSIAYVTMKIADYIFQDNSHQRRAFLRTLTFFCVLSYYPLSYWSLMGMETGLLALLLLLSILLSFRYAQRGNFTNMLLVSVCLGLAYLTRPDSIIFALLIWVYIAWGIKLKSNQDQLYKLPVAIALFLLFVVGQLIFQYLYYGEMLPNTYTLKLTGMSLFGRIRNGTGFIIPFLIVTAPILILASIDLISGFQKRKLLMLSIVFSAIGYEVYVGGDPWLYWRIMAPSIPLAIILAINFVSTKVFALTSSQAFKLQFLPEALVIGLTLIGMISANNGFIRELLLLDKPYTTEYNAYYVSTAIVLNQVTTSDATVGVFWAGSIPYYTDRVAVDFLGKSDKYIANLPPDISGNVSWNGMRSVPGHNKYDLNYSIKTLEPTYVQRFWWGAQDLSQYAETKYVVAEYNGISFFLLKDSPAVLWSKVNIP